MHNNLFAFTLGWGSGQNGVRVMLCLAMRYIMRVGWVKGLWVEGVLRDYGFVFLICSLKGMGLGEGVQLTVTLSFSILHASEMRLAVFRKGCHALNCASTLEEGGEWSERRAGPRRQK